MSDKWISDGFPEDYIGDFIDKKCPKCGAQMLGNKKDDEWCSYVGCDYGCEESYKSLGLTAEPPSE